MHPEKLESSSSPSARITPLRGRFTLGARLQAIAKAFEVFDVPVLPILSDHIVDQFLGHLCLLPSSAIAEISSSDSLRAKMVNLRVAFCRNRMRAGVVVILLAICCASAG